MKNGQKIVFFFLFYPHFSLSTTISFVMHGAEKQRHSPKHVEMSLCGAKPYHFEVYDWGQLFLRYFLSHPSHQTLAYQNFSIDMQSFFCFYRSKRLFVFTPHSTRI
jgi:hypothetical protein